MIGLNENGNKWVFIGVGRDDGLEAGEYSPIIYQSDIWTLCSFKYVWLSKTPDRPSKSWDAALPRMLTIAKFQHCQSKKLVVAMNTHLDDQGSRSRLEAAKIILKEVSLIGDREDDSKTLPIFLAGDFNSEPTQEAYKTITSEDSPFYDLHQLVPENIKYGNINTFTGFGPGTQSPTRIDFLFINHHAPKHASESEPSKRNTHQWGVDGYGVLANRFEDAVYSSDHRAVVGDLLM
jgi:endonuclease/exonuclease/phosphatase family metal-dependent hydrolase